MTIERVKDLGAKVPLRAHPEFIWYLDLWRAFASSSCEDWRVPAQVRSGDIVKELGNQPGLGGVDIFTASNSLSSSGSGRMATFVENLYFQDGHMI